MARGVPTLLSLATFCSMLCRSYSCLEAAWAAKGRASNRLRAGTIRRSMNLSWFDDWRFDMRRSTAFPENRAGARLGYGKNSDYRVRAATCTAIVPRSGRLATLFSLSHPCVHPHPFQRPAGMSHAVARLRAERLARSNKPFIARGSRAERCPDCRVIATHCLCAWKPRVQAESGVCLLMHDT